MPVSFEESSCLFDFSSMKLRWWLMIVWASTILMCTTSQSSPSPPSPEDLFLCQPTSEINSATVYTPNIPESYFSAEHLQQENFRGSSPDTFVFSVPDESEQRRNCSGSIVAIEYCYKVINNDLLQQSEQDVFTFYSLTTAGRGRGQERNFMINDSYMVKTTSSRNCAGEYCCDRTTLNTQFPSTKYAFGVNASASSVIRQLRLAFRTERSHQNCRRSSSMLTCSNFIGPILLLRLIIANNGSSSSVDTSLSTTPSSPKVLNTMMTIAAENNMARSPFIAGFIVASIVVLVAVLIALIVIIVMVVKCHKKELRIHKNGATLSNAVYGMNGDGESKSNDYTQNIGPQLSRDITTVPNGREYATIEAGQYEIPSVSRLQNANYNYKMDSTLLENGSAMDGIYMAPAKDETALYAQLQDIMTQNVTRSSVQLGEHLGSGQFGVVYKGVLECGEGEEGKVEVAVKTLKEGSAEENRVKFLQEAAIMGQFKHHNVVTMYGVVTIGEPVLLVLELLSKGDLRMNLLQMRAEDDGEVTVDNYTLLSYCRQVASGMAYLSSKAFVHRDLAARNILVSDDDICKIADFGMSRDLADESYYVSHGGKIPVKWTAPEALHYKKYSTASDVWSYGALMYEIWSVGHKPFENETNSKVMRLLESGYRLPPPPGCARALYNIMIECWHPMPSKRPSFPDMNRMKLSLPDSKLLKWSEEDKAVHPEAAKLGADLLSAQELYKDLQMLYHHDNN